MNYGYQPYNNYYNQYGMQGYLPQNNINQTYQNIPRQQTMQQQNQNNCCLQGWFVDGYDVTKSINADMSGGAMFFPSTDGKEIYKKQLDINTGKSDTLVYKLIEQTQEEEIHTEIDFSQIYECIGTVKKELMEQMSEIKEMVLDSITTPPVSTDNFSRKVGVK